LTGKVIDSEIEYVGGALSNSKSPVALVITVTPFSVTGTFATGFS
jgi:hypothetical protein